MIEILEVKEDKRIKDLQENLDVKDCTLLEMTERNVSLGVCALKLREKQLFILKLYIEGYNFTEKPDTEQFFILDSLVRSAASYGETNGADKIIIDFPEFFDFFKRMGFKDDAGEITANIDLIVKYHN